MGVCGQLLPVFVMSFVVMVLTVRHFSLLEPRDDLCTLDIDYGRMDKCFRMFSAITKEMDDTRRCMAAMYRHQTSPLENEGTEICSVYENIVKESIATFKLRAYYHITYGDVASVLFTVFDSVINLESCWTNLGLSHTAIGVSGPHCVNNLHDRVWEITSDIAQCLDFPTTGKKLWEQIGSLGSLPHIVLFEVLLDVLLPSLRRMSVRTKTIAILLILAALILFVFCHFVYKERLMQDMFRVIASNNVLSHGIFRRIEVIDLDEFLDRDHSKWRPLSSRDKNVWRYIGEDVLLMCNIILSFNITKFRQEDFVVDWFHNGRKLEFTLRHNVFTTNITIRGNIGAISMVIIMRQVEAEDFGSYSCNISRRFQPFLTLYLDQSYPTEIHQILPLEVIKSINPGSMLKVKYSAVIISSSMKYYAKFYRRVNDRTMKWTLGQPIENCNLWTVLQNGIYNMIDVGPKIYVTPSEVFGTVQSFCVPSEDFGRHEFVIERFDNTAFRTHTHPVSLVVKPVGKISKSEYNDFFEAVSTLFDALLLILLGFISDITGSVVTFCFLLFFKFLIRKFLPVVAVRFLKQVHRKQKIYIACSPRDRVWTNRNVVEFLESLGHETFIYARDSLPNEYETRGYSRGIEACHKYVMVVSRHFLEGRQWEHERNLIVEELRRRQCCPDGEHPKCLLFVCLGAAEVPGPRVGGSVVHAPQARRRGGLRCQVRSWLEDAVFREEEWNTWYLLGVSVLITICQSRTFAVIFSRSVLQESYSTFMKWLSPET